jgi:TolB-like protein
MPTLGSRIVTNSCSVEDEPPVSDQPSPDDVRAQLRRILTAPDLQSSPARRELLRFVVEETLAGRVERLKGATLAHAVFGRNDDFDPQSDPVVRVEARRLRRDLDSYYVTAGKQDPVVISIPKGGYVPHFAWGDVDPAPNRLPDLDRSASDDAVRAAPAGDWFRGTRKAAALLAATILVVVGSAALWSRHGPDRATEPGTAGAAHGPAVIVLPFKALSAREDDRFLAAGITQELITNLMRFPDFRLFSELASFRRSAAADPVELGKSLGVSYVVRGSIGSSAAVVRVSAQLMDASSGEMIWSDTYDRPLTPGDLLAVQGEIAARLASILGQSYGIVRNDVAERTVDVTNPSMSSYLCVLRAYTYRRSFQADLYPPVVACLEEAVQRDPEYSEAWAMLGWLRLDAVRFGWDPDANTERAYADALATASRGVAADRTNVMALKALSSTNHYLGNFEESERLAREALALNPNDPDTLAQLGWRMAVRGNFDEGIPYLERAIARTISPPGWYFHLIAVDLYLRGDYQGMLAAAERDAVNGSGISYSLLAIAHGALGNREAARQALGRMAEATPLLGRDPAAVYRRHQAIDPIVDALVAGLRRAGWTEGSGSPQS